MFTALQAYLKAQQGLLGIEVSPSSVGSFLEELTEQNPEESLYFWHLGEGEKHSAHYLSELAAQYGDKLWGLKMEPLGDYRSGRVFDFSTGVDLTDSLMNSDRSAERQPLEPEASANGHSHPSTPNDPYQLQAQRTTLVAPIIKDYLTLAQTHHHQGQKYAATWDAQSQTLSLLDKSSATLKLVAQQENNQWHSQPIPLSDPLQPNLSQADVEHFQALAPKIAEKLAQLEQQYRTIYESAKDFIQAAHGQAPADIDVKIAISVLNQTNDPQKALQVLSVSDTARDWQQSLTSQQYQQQLSAYLKQTFQAAQQLERQQPYAQPAWDFDH